MINFLINLSKMSKYYAVKTGRINGIYTSWADCQKNVIGFKGAMFKSFSNIKDAEDYINEDISQIENFTESLLTRKIYVDAGHNKETGDSSWASIVNSNGDCLIREYKSLFSEFELRDVIIKDKPRTIIIIKIGDLIQQNNNGELIALISGLKLALNIGYINEIYSDSDLMVKYWSKKLGNEQRLKFEPLKVQYIDELISLRKQFEAIGGNITKISGDFNLADIGYHR